MFFELESRFLQGLTNRKHFTIFTKHRPTIFAFFRSVEVVLIVALESILSLTFSIRDYAF